MKSTLLAAAIAVALSGTLVAGCDRDQSASGGSTAQKDRMGGPGGATPGGATGGAQSDAPKRPASPTGPGGSSK